MSDNGRPTLAESVKSALVGFNGLNDEERRQFYWALQNPARAATETPPQEHADPWQAFTLADAYQERPPVQYVAAGLFALPSLNIPYGAPGTLKSFLLADLCVCVAGGVEWLPPSPWVKENAAKPIPTRKNPVMWLDFDNGRRRTHDRFAALGRARELSPDIPLFYYSMPSPWLNASDKASIGDLSLRILDKGAKLIVADNLGVISGDAEENSSKMSQVMSLFRQMAEETGAAVVLVHHQRKSGIANSRAGDSLRGHSSIEAALDVALLLEREELSDTVTLKATKARGEDILPFSAYFSFEHDERGELLKAKFFGVAIEDVKSGGAIEREIMIALVGRAVNKGELTKAVKEALPDVGLNRIRDMIERLATAGKLSVTPGSKTERLYSRGGHA